MAWRANHAYPTSEGPPSLWKEKRQTVDHVRSASGLLPRKEINSSLRMVRTATCGEGGFSWGLSSLELKVSYEYGQKARKRKGRKKNKGEEEKKEGRMMDRRKGKIGRRKKKQGTPQCRCWVSHKGPCANGLVPPMALLEMWASGRFLVQRVICSQISTGD